MKPNNTADQKQVNDIYNSVAKLMGWPKTKPNDSSQSSQGVS
jgi:hypothetical protein